MAKLDTFLNNKNLLTIWDFNGTVTSQGQYVYTPEFMVEGQPRFVHDGIFGEKALYLRRGDWLSLKRTDCPALNIHGVDASLTVMAWLKRLPQAETYDCETIAGVWDESRKKRQYCLFLDLPIHDSGDQVGGHVSSHGGPTPGHPYCMDAAIGAMVLNFDRWYCVAFSYNGEYARSYLDGVLDIREGRNPFHYPYGLYDGGPGGADFTIGAVSRSGEPGNFFHGILGGLAVFDVALDDDIMRDYAAFLEE
ncbi:MAG: LamG-like jellyroll fold domain-containing protein [Aggregatilineales bacterium]